VARRAITMTVLLSSIGVLDNAPVEPAPEETPWRWVGTLQFAVGLPATVVATVCAILLKRLGAPNADVAAYTGALVVPWMLKPLWSPLLEAFRTKRFFVVTCEALVAVGMAGISVGLGSESRIAISLGLLAVIAVLAATHDIAADGLYLCTLSPSTQARYVGWMTVGFHSARLTTQGLLVVMVGALEAREGLLFGWQMAFLAFAALAAGLAMYHAHVLPKGEPEQRAASAGAVASITMEVVRTFFQRKSLPGLVLLALFYRLADGQIARIAPLFLLDPEDQGGLALTTAELGVLYGGLGVCAFIGGGLIGSRAAARRGLRNSIVWLCAAFHLPAFVYLFLAWRQPRSIAVIAVAIMTEQLMLGIGSIGQMLVLFESVAGGRYQTAHFAFAAALCGLCPTLAGMLSGTVQARLGYAGFFTWALVTSIPALIAAVACTRDRRKEKRPAGTDGEGTPRPAAPDTP
jgi:PAT family beta-lactamase induction signal transducer AmpG